MFLQTIKKLYAILKGAFTSFTHDSVMKLCASLSFYTVFSLPPLIIIIIAFCGVFLGKEAIQGQLFFEIQSVVGPQVALQIQDIIKNLKIYNNNGIAAFIGGLMLIFGASGVFSEIQSSINLIWKIEVHPHTGFVGFLKDKLVSFSMIGTVSFLLVVCLIINTIIDLLNYRLEYLFKDSTVMVIKVINLLILFMVITLLFLIIFKTLPYKKMKWKYIWTAALSTSFLFMIGKYLIGIYLGNSNVMTTYGAAGTLIVLLTWVYYSAMILYFGAEIAKSYARVNGDFDKVKK